MPHKPVESKLTVKVHGEKIQDLIAEYINELHADIPVKARAKGEDITLSISNNKLSHASVELDVS